MAALPYIAEWVTEAPTLAKAKEEATQHIVKDLIPSAKEAHEALIDYYKKTQNDLVKKWVKVIQVTLQKIQALGPALNTNNQTVEKPKSEEDAQKLQEKQKATEQEKVQLEQFKLFCGKLVNKYKEDRQILEQLQNKEDLEHEGIMGWMKEKWEDVTSDDSNKVLYATDVFINSLQDTISKLPA